eukprot:UN32183
MSPTTMSSIRERSRSKSRTTTTTNKTKLTYQSPERVRPTTPNNTPLSLTNQHSNRHRTSSFSCSRASQGSAGYYDNFRSRPQSAAKNIAYNYSGKKSRRTYTIPVMKNGTWCYMSLEV